MKKIISLTFLIFSATFCISQISVPFKVRYQSYVNGDMTIIANNITNRADSNNANIPYTSRTNMHKLNDEFMMDYIDIDNDPNTFSSSSAELNLENSSTKKIIYAGLYWSATYLGKSSHMVKETEFVIDDPKREYFNEIKLKLPNQENYLDIKGEVIFDGFNIKKFKESAPYAVYADITKEVLKLTNPFGNYTVANIKATTGTISGGVAAGWTMFFIYEDTQMKGKFITSFDGFAGVSDRLIEIVFSGFSTLPEGIVEAKIAGSTLEGDYNLKGDQLLFKTNNKNKYIPLSSLLRNEANFFNSSITIGNDYFMSRKPDSKNTLGYDAFLISVPNPNNSVIGNNSKQATIRLKSSGDRCFLFFTAFEVAVTEQEKPIIPIETKQELITTISDSIKKVKNVPVVITNSDVKTIDNSLNSSLIIAPQEVKKQEVTVIKTITPDEKVKQNVVKVPEQPFVKNDIVINNDTSTVEKSSNTIDLKKKPIVLETNEKELLAITVPVVSEDKQNANKNIYNNTQAVSVNSENKIAEKTETKIIALSENKTTKSEIIPQTIIENKLDHTIETKNEFVSTKKNILTSTKTDPQINPEITQSNVKENKQDEIFNYNIEGVNKEYYIIANVFAKERNKSNFIKYLKSKGYNADYFYNPIKKYYYVYIDKGLDKDKIQALHDTKINKTYKDDIWVLSINMPKTTEAVAIKETPKEVVKQKETIVNTTIPKESINVEPKAITDIVTIDKPTEIQKPESDLIVTKAIVKSTVNKPTERIDAITDKNLEDKNTKVALVETDLNSLPSLQTSITENVTVNTTPITEIAVSTTEKKSEIVEAIKPIETISVNKSESVAIQNKDENSLEKEIKTAEIKNEINSANSIKETTEMTSQIVVSNSVTVPQTKPIVNSTLGENINTVPQNTPTTSNQAIKNIDVVSNTTNQATNKFKKEEIVNYNFAGLSKGFYIVANVFAKQRNSINFVNALKRKGINAASFYNPIKKYYYVYIEKSNDKAEIEGLYNTKINNTYKESIWVLSINNPIKQEILVVI